ncbi:MAG: pseudouridine synthase Rsu [Firmicutes bacterium]|nr:pseudouridine synthase Rsu [Bacillota bacterium]
MLSLLSCKKLPDSYKTKGVLVVERLQKILSQAGVCSRREAETRILAGRVMINGQVVTELGVKVDPVQDEIVVDGKRIAAQKHIYILLNKPTGVVTTLSDPQRRRTVADLLHGISERVYPVGRLDYHTQGLLLLTNDGDLANRLMHPRQHVDKTYVVKAYGTVSEDRLDILRTGIKLSDGITAPALIRILSVDNEQHFSMVEVTIHEGKNRQIRRMFEAIGHPVKQLERTRIAFLTLQNLPAGSFRHLTKDEVNRLKKLAEK